MVVHLSETFPALNVTSFQKMISWGFIVLVFVVLYLRTAFWLGKWMLFSGISGSFVSLGLFPIVSRDEWKARRQGLKNKQSNPKSS